MPDSPSPADADTTVDGTGDGRGTAQDMGTDERDALLSRLQVIEDQPLEDRAAAFVQLHDELRAALEGADTSA